MRSNFARLSILGLALASTCALADNGASLLGTWSGTDSFITSKSLTAAHHDFNKAILTLQEQITVDSVSNGLCLASLYFDTPGKVLIDASGRKINHRATKALPCAYDDSTFMLTMDNNALINCKYSASNMTCFITNSRPDHQGAAVLHLTKQATNA